MKFQFPSPMACLRVLWLVIFYTTTASGQMTSGSIPGEYFPGFNPMAQSTGTTLLKGPAASSGQGETLPASHQWFALPLPPECHKGTCSVYFSAAMPGGVDCTDMNDNELSCQQAGPDILQPTFKAVTPGTILHLWPKAGHPESGHRYIVLTTAREKPEGSERAVKSVPAPPLFIDTAGGGFFPEFISPVVPLLNCSGDNIHFVYYPLLSEPALPAYLLSLVRGKWFESPPGFMLLLDHCQFDADEINELVSSSLPEGFSESLFVRKIQEHLSYLEVEGEQKLADTAGVLAYRETINSAGGAEYQVYGKGQWHEESRYFSWLRDEEELDRIFGIDTGGPYGYDTPNNIAYKTLMQQIIREEQRESRLKSRRRQSEKNRIPANRPAGHRFTPRMLGGGGGSATASTPVPSATSTAPLVSATATPAVMVSPTPAPPVPFSQEPTEKSITPDAKSESQGHPGGASASGQSAQAPVTSFNIKGTWFTTKNKFRTSLNCGKCKALLDENVVQDDGIRFHKDCGKSAANSDKAFCMELAELRLTCSACNDFTDHPYLEQVPGLPVCWKNNAAEHAESHLKEIQCDQCGFISGAFSHDEQKADLLTHQSGHCLIPCQLCGFNYEKKEEGEHFTHCPKSQIQCCVKSCGKNFPKEEYLRHLLTERAAAGNTVLECPSCQQFKASIATMLTHVKGCLNPEQYACEIKGPEGIACHTSFYNADNYLSHVLMLHPDHYAEALLGSDSSDTMADTDIATFRKASMAVSQPAAKRPAATVQPDAESAEQVSKLSRGLKFIEEKGQEFQERYKKAMAEITQILSELEKESSARKEASAQVVVPVAPVDAGIRVHNLNVVMNAVNQVKDKLAALDARLIASTRSLGDMQLRQDILEAKSTNGLLIWKIPDIYRRHLSAKNDEVVSLYSPPFYTSLHGYKMCIRTYLNGDGTGKGTHVSVFFVLMKSDYDNLLPWPFRQKVRLTLINQKNKDASITKAFIPNQESPSFQKPQDGINVANGFPEFAEQDILNDENFTLGDMIYLKCQVETLGLENQ